MKEFDMDKIYKARRDKVASWLKEHSVFAVVFEDTEGARDVAIRYLTGHPSDRLRQQVLIPPSKVVSLGRAFLCSFPLKRNANHADFKFSQNAKTYCLKTELLLCGRMQA